MKLIEHHYCEWVTDHKRCGRRAIGIDPYYMKHSKADIYRRWLCQEHTDRMIEKFGIVMAKFPSR